LARAESPRSRNRIQKSYDQHDHGTRHAYCKAIAKLTAESLDRVLERISVVAEGIIEEEGMYREYPDPAQRYEDLHRDRLEEEKHQRLEEEGMYCTPYDPETDTEPTETRTEYCYRMGFDM